jgi:hypothetical protein
VIGSAQEKVVSVARQIPEEDLQAIIEVVSRHPDGVSAQDISDALERRIKHRTLQYRLSHLVAEGKLVQEGEARAARYLIAAEGNADETAEIAADSGEQPVAISKAGAAVQRYVSQPVAKRKPVGYDRVFLDAYHPNKSNYLSEGERAHLHGIGSPRIAAQAAGTYAKQILNRLLIDLSWNSSRLEGNTYSLLDTKRLIDFGQAAEGKDQLEAQMILNHKDAIEFLVTEADEIGFNRYTILNLHAMLANNLLPDPNAPGRLRQIAVGIESSTFHPLEVPQLIEECFDQVLATAAAIEDPFEQAFFVMVQLPYLQAFDDANKRVSRLAANIPLIKANLMPLAFTDVSQEIYTQAILGVYELNDTALLKDVFVWAYERSAARYAAVRQSLGEPDPFRLRHREAMRQIIGDIVRRGMNRKAAASHLVSWVRENIPTDEQEKFREVAENELLGLHEGNFARYQIRPAEFAAWQGVWAAGDR